MAARASSSAPARERPRYEDDPSPQLLAPLRKAFPTFTPTAINWWKVESAIKEVHHANHQEQHDAFCREYFELTAEALIRFMQAEGMLPPAEPSPAKRKKPFSNITQCLLHLMGTAGGRDRISACGTLQDVCNYIREEYPDQPATPQLLKARGAWPDENVGGMKWRWAKATRRRGRTVVPGSRLSEDQDFFNSFECRRPVKASGHGAPAPLRCAECGDTLTSPPVQKDGKVYCQPCGNELLYGDIPAP